MDVFGKSANLLSFWKSLIQETKNQQNITKYKILKKQNKLIVNALREEQ